MADKFCFRWGNETAKGEKGTGGPPFFLFFDNRGGSLLSSEKEKKAILFRVMETPIHRNVMMQEDASHVSATCFFFYIFFQPWNPYSVLWS